MASWLPLGDTLYEDFYIMKILIFGGTTEGRKLSEALSNKGIGVTLSVATDYSNTAKKSVAIHSARLVVEDMIDLIKQNDFNCVIDATHPYAVLATQNIRSACESTGMKYFRLKRSENACLSGITYVPDVLSAIEILKKNNEKVILTIGSKELESFIGIENFAQRFFIRILPMTDSLKKALGLGFQGSNIICMQGPFDKGMNLATLKMTGAKFLVTKESGDVGGFEAKVSAALSLDCKVIVIARPCPEEGYTLDEMMEHFGANKNAQETFQQKAYFPLFIDMNGRKVLVIGGGNVAERRINILAGFGAEITVISPMVTEGIKQAASLKTISLIKRKYKEGDLTGLMPFLVIAATNERKVNQKIMTEARGLNIHVSVADCRRECTCYFPAIAENDAYIAGIVSKNGNHAGLKEMAKKTRELFGL